LDSGVIQNNVASGGVPDYLSLSEGVGRGAGFANQFRIEAGSGFDDLCILANDDIKMRGGLTNGFGNVVFSRQAFQARNY